MSSDESLSGTRYRADRIPGYIASVEAYITGGDPLLWNDRALKFTQSAIIAGTKKDRVPPQSPFFEAMELMKSVIDRYNDTVKRFRITIIKQLFKSVSRETDMQSLSSGERGFDDLIRDVYLGLVSKSGKRLGEKVRSRYGAALIDEFQDTDGMQFAIFSSMFGSGSALFMIGDPKQAIYRFRGADIFSYMHAADMAESKYTLARNWRSTPGLIDAVNRIFGGCENPFVFEKIGFNPVMPGKEGQGDDLLGPDGAVSPLVFEIVDYRAEGDEYEPDRDNIIAARLAAEISSMLSRGYTIGGKGLVPEDIAVLVRTNNQAAIVKDSLAAAGIPAVTRSTGSVFSSAEAAELYFVLSAILDPSDQRRLRTALATGLCGFSAGDIALMADGHGAAASEKGEEASSRFFIYRDAWNRGFMEMFTMFMNGDKVAERLFSGAGGARKMANLLHIAELLRDEAAASRLGPADTLDRLARYIADPPEGDLYSMRLETDDMAVKVMTMHSSKGLEFPVVFCPYLASAPGRGEDVTVYHENDGSGSVPVIYLDSDLPEDVKLRRDEEDRAESARLIYVALTRAKSHCRVMMKITSTFGKTVLSDILFRFRIRLQSVITDDIDDESAELMLRIISEDSGGSIGFIRGQGFAAEAAVQAKPEPELECREFKGDASQRWMMYSYSGIAASLHHGDEKDDEGGSVSFRPGPDVLPPGARSGLCLHEIFENCDFTWESRELFAEKAVESLERYGFGSGYAGSVTDMVINVLRSPLDSSGLRLSLIGQDERLNELEFHFPVEALPGLKNLVPGYDPNPRINTAPDELPAMKGMMKGYIDLIFTHCGRYYIVDWKSNMLELSHGDYSYESMSAEMNRHNYHLQYHIYTVALHRYLAMRLGDSYDYEKHFGGVFYLFIRGMNGTGKEGVFSARPELEITRQLDSIFRGHEQSELRN
jgi:exodeoxyribonuclease V beta subunit